jgi:hypothetical protein
MQRIPGGIIRPFFIPVSGRIPDFVAGYPANVDLIILLKKIFFLQIRSGKEVSTEIILVPRNFFAFCLERIVIFKACLKIYLIFY